MAGLAPEFGAVRNGAPVFPVVELEAVSDHFCGC